jgi:hypothetical protein
MAPVLSYAYRPKYNHEPCVRALGKHRAASALLIDRALTSWVCADSESGKANARREQLFLDGTPSNLVMQTPSLNQFGGSPNFTASPLAAPQALLFTPSSRKLLRSMAPNPLDTIPDDLPTGLTPHVTPQTQRGPASAAGKRTSSSCKLSGRRAHAHGDAPDDGDSDGEGDDKPSAIRRLSFGRSEDGVAAVGASPDDSAMRPPPPPAAFESPLKRLRHQRAGSPDAAQKPLFVPATTDAAGSIMLPETPSQDAVTLSAANASAPQVPRADVPEPCPQAANEIAAPHERGLSDSSTGRNSVVSTVEHMQSQESLQAGEREAAYGDSMTAIAAVHGGSSLLKSQIDSMLDSVFV